MNSMNNRTGRIIHTQQEALVRYLEANPDLAKGRPKTSEANHLNRVQWHELAKTLNAIEGGVYKSGKAWAKYWADKKCLLKKAAKQNCVAKRNLSEDAQYMSSLDVRLLTVLNSEEVVSEADPMPFGVVTKEPAENCEEPASPCPASLEADSRSASPAEEPPTSPPMRGRVKAEPLRYPRRGPKWIYRSRSPLHTEWKRLANMEEKRIQADCMMAKAQHESATAMAQCAAAIEALTGAVRSQGVDVAEALRSNGQMIAEALQAQSKMIAEALQRKGDT